MFSTQKTLAFLLGFFMSISTSFGDTSKPTKKSRLSDQILTFEEVLKLTPSQQLVYFYGMIYLTEVVEKDEQAPLTVETAQVQKNQFTEPHLFDFLIEPAEAVVPFLAAPVVAGLLTNGARLAIPRAIPVMRGAVEKFFSLGTLVKSSVVSGVAGAAVTEVAHQITSDKPQPPPPKVEGPATSPIAQAKSLEPQEDTISAIPDYKKPGKACLFGGHISMYKKMNDGQILCTRPPQTVNEPPCLGSSEKPQFKCQSLGLLNGETAADNSASSFCVPLYSAKGLKDLTERCMARAGNLIKALPTRLDVEAYKKWVEAIKPKLDEYERFKAGNDQLSFKEYCEQSNARNSGEQGHECVAVKKILAQLRKEIPEERTVGVAPAPPQRNRPAEDQKSAK